MKKLILALAGAILSAGILSAQDKSQATELYNNGATAIEMENYTEALDYFQQALAMGNEIGDDAAELVEKCKEIIPKVSLQIAKNLIKEEKYEEAAAQIESTSKLAAEFENDEIVAEAKELVPQMWLMKGKKAVELKDFAAAADAFTKSYDADTTNASTALTLAQVLGALGKTDQAVDVLQHAIWNGKEAEAKKQMGKLYVSQANAALKANKLADAVAAANKANAVEPNATACLIAGQASQKLGKANDAIANFTKYLELQPDAKNANAITFTVAALYQQAKNNAKALEFYKKVADDPKFGAQAKQMIAALGK